MSEWSWGVDVSTTRLAIGAIRPDGQWWTKSLDLPLKSRGDGGVRLAQLRYLTYDFARTVPVGRRPTVIVVENPMTRHNHFMLVASAGVVIEALYSTLRCPVLELGIQKWKKEVIGNGNASKDAVTAHAAGLGYLGPVQDEADALCVAVAGLNRLPV